MFSSLWLCISISLLKTLTSRELDHCICWTSLRRVDRDTWYLLRLTFLCKVFCSWSSSSLWYPDTSGLISSYILVSSVSCSISVIRVLRTRAGSSFQLLTSFHTKFPKVSDIQHFSVLSLISSMHSSSRMLTIISHTTCCSSMITFVHYQYDDLSWSFRLYNSTWQTVLLSRSSSRSLDRCD